MYGYIDSEEAVAAQLAAADAVRDVKQTRKLMRRVLQLSASRVPGSGQRSLLPHVVKLLASSDFLIKKLSSWYILQTCDQQDLVLLAVNTLLKDCRDSNPMIRGQALRTLASLHQEDLTQYAVDPLLSSLQDPSAYVRRIAVTGSMKIYSSHPHLLSDTGLVDSLYTMIRDTDPVVVTNSLSALEAILSGEGGVVINRNIAHYLLNHLAMFTEWGLITVFDMLGKYGPAGEEEVLDIMNLTDGYLKHHSLPVVMACLQYFLKLISQLPQLRAHVFLRTKPQLVASLGAGNPELTFVLLEFIASVIDEHEAALVENYRAFFCKYSEPAYVKERKISLLPRLVTNENCSEILEELKLYCTDLNPAISERAVAAVATTANTSPAHWEVCVDHLVDLLKLEVDYVSSNVLQVLQWVDLQRYEQLDQLLLLLPPSLQILTSGTAATWWLLGQYGEDVEDAPYLLEESLNNVSAETGPEVSLQLLTAAVKLFLKRPAETQDCLGRALEIFSKTKNHDVADRAQFYYNLLKTDVHLARQLILDHSDIDRKSETLIT